MPSASVSLPAARALSTPLQEGEYTTEGGLSIWPAGGRMEFNITSPWFCGPHVEVTHNDDGTVSSTAMSHVEYEGETYWARLEHDEWKLYTRDAMMEISHHLCCCSRIGS